MRGWGKWGPHWSWCGQKLLFYSLGLKIENGGLGRMRFWSRAGPNIAAVFFAAWGRVIHGAVIRRKFCGAELSNGSQPLGHETLWQSFCPYGADKERRFSHIRLIMASFAASWKQLPSHSRHHQNRFSSLCSPTRYSFIYNSAALVN
jgi:hypothetical protein